MRNLGPACEQDLCAVGITTAEQLKELGAEAAFVRILVGRKEQGRSLRTCNATYLYALYGAIHDIDWREIPAARKLQFKAFTGEIRNSGVLKS